MKNTFKRKTAYKLICLSVALLLGATGMAEERLNQYEAVTLSHVTGCQSVGLRAGHGTKNIIDFGLTYAYCFNTRMSFLVELDHERAFFGYTEFINTILVSPGFEHNLINSTRWFYWHWGLGPAVGYDKWLCDLVDVQEKGLCFGAQVGTGVEFIPWTKFSFVVKAQQYALFSKAENYLKPNFSLAVRFNFHR